MQRGRLLLAEIIDAAQRVIDLAVERSAVDGAVDPRPSRRAAVELHRAGEAISQLSETTRSRHREVPWSDPVRLRSRIVHGYWSVDLDVLLATARDDLPAFLAASCVVAASMTDAEGPGLRARRRKRSYGRSGPDARPYAGVGGRAIAR